MNLLINAAQAIGENGEISVESNLLRTKGQVRIVVRDTGPGIAPAIQNKIFEPFFTTKGPRDGTGLGLSLSYGIVRDHGGEIYVRSKPGKGAAFIIILPLFGA
jgi:signal transduction histidine kinase